MPWFGSRSSSKVDKSAVLSEIQRQIPAIVQVNSQRQNWPATLTGVYGEASAARTNEAPDSGILVLLETNGRIVAISTTNNSFWAGSCQAGKIEAMYVNKSGITGTLSLQLAPDGSDVAGTWRVPGDSGTYKAYRTQGYDQQTVAAKLRGISVA